MAKRKIFFAYIRVKRFSGQTFASEFIKKVLVGSNEFEIRDIPLYPVDRLIKIRIFAFFSWIYKTVSTIPNIFELIISKNSILYLNVGQSYFSFFRVLWWYLPFKIINNKASTIISLHGNDFLSWGNKSLRMLTLKIILKSANIITLLGNNQKKKLLANGISEYKLIIVPNTVDMQVLDSDSIKKKQSNIGTLNILFLSLLVESKGFPEFLESLEFISKNSNNVKTESILCGPMIRTKFCKRFNSIEEASSWINNKTNVINNNESMNVTWKQGAYGAEKEKLFKWAHIFVLPTKYPNEAQPLVLLEAMATGCAIITSKMGEIPNTITDKEAILLEDVNYKTISDSIMSYYSENLRIDKTQNALRLFNDKYSLKVYSDNWLRIFRSC